MTVHYLRYDFLRKIDVPNELDEDYLAYQDNLTLNQLRKVFGPYNVFEVERIEVLPEDYQPEGS